MYVAPNGSRAASAGTYLLYASHIAAMAPGTHVGAATPIALSAPGLPGAPPPSKSEKQSESDPTSSAERKSINDAVAYIRSLAEIRGRNADWGEKAVREAATLTATAALKQKVIDVIARDVDELLSSIDGRSITTASGEVQLATKGRRVVEIKPDWKMELMSAITDPNIALILLMIGIYGIIFEFLTPGAVAPGVVGGVCLIVALTALSVLPVNLGGLALLLFGIALMVVEAFAPSVVIGLGGLVAFVLGALFLFDPGDTDIPIKFLVGARWDGGAQRSILHGCIRVRRAGAPSPRADRCGRNDRKHGQCRGLGTGSGPYLGIWRNVGGVVEPGPCQGPEGAHRGSHGAHTRGRAKHLIGEGDMSDMQSLGSLLSGALPLLVIVAIAAYSIRILREYERGVVFLLGRFWKVKGPGLVIIVPFIQQMVRMDLRTRVLDVPPQDVISRDNVSVKVNAVVYFRVIDPEKAVIQVEQYEAATSQFAQTTLRSVLGQHDLDQMLAEREKLNTEVQRILDERTDAWGIKVSNVELKHIDLNESMICAIAKQAEAERLRRAKIIDAEGELQAAERLAQAGEILSRRPEAMQLRYLGTLLNIAGERSSTIVFPLPMDLAKIARDRAEGLS